MLTEITDDEFTLLGIAKEGQPVAPIGRWKESVLSLSAKGLLHCVDNVNYTITSAGRDAWTARDADDDSSLRRLLEGNNKIANARTTAQQSVEQAALHLSFAAKASALATGNPVMFALEQWLPIVRERAIEILKDG